MEKRTNPVKGLNASWWVDRDGHGNCTCSHHLQTVCAFQPLFPLSVSGGGLSSFRQRGEHD